MEPATHPDDFKVTLIDGNLYDPWEPSGPVPEPWVIAHGLARLCRYGGAIMRDNYTVAEHSIWVALKAMAGPNDTAFAAWVEWVDVLTKEKDAFLAGVCAGISAARVRAGLLGLVHDAPEACGLVDLPAPVGRRKEMKPYKEAHERCFRWLLEGWGLLPLLEHAEEIDRIDKSIIGAERCLRANNGRGHGAHEPWPGLNIAKDHDLWRRYGPTGIASIWVRLFGRLKSRPAATAEAESRVHHPSHYNAHPSGVEAIEICEHLPFNLGNAIKYLWRADHKGASVEDLQKSRWYWERATDQKMGVFLTRDNNLALGERIKAVLQAESMGTLLHHALRFLSQGWISPPMVALIDEEIAKRQKDAP